LADSRPASAPERARNGVGAFSKDIATEEWPARLDASEVEKAREIALDWPPQPRGWSQRNEKRWD